MIYRLILFASLLLCASFVKSQIDFEQRPISFKVNQFDYDQLHVYEGEAIDVDALLLEDESNASNFMRSGVTKNIGVDLTNSGSWLNLGDGSRIWLCRLKAPNAVATSVYLKNLKIPDGGFINFYDPQKEVLRGAYDSRSFHERGNFTHDDIPGEEIIIELYEPANAIGQSFLTVESLGYTYIMPEHLLKTSGSCNVDVNCSEGSAWEAQKKAVVRIKIYKGGWTGWCSGTLMNNTAQDCRPLILTAWHCGLGNGFSDPTQNDLDNYIFYFNYERSQCNGGTVTNDQVLGCNMLGNSQDQGGDQGSDFMLVELNAPVPWDYHVYYAGWDATNNGSPSGVTMHHPSGDYKKVSTYTSQTISDAYGSATGSHWRVSWVATSNGHGVTEGGSSGGPLFNSQGNVIGQLTGGGASCSNPAASDLYGKMFYNWNANIGVGGDALKPLLDPGNTGTLTLFGTYPPCVANLDEKESSIDGINLYPNPSKGILNISSPNISTYQYSMFTTDGKKVLNGQIQQQENVVLNIQYLSKGVYFITIQSAEVFITKKIVVE